MSYIEASIGHALVRIDTTADTVQADGNTFPHYNPRDLMDATAAALLGINTPQSVKWAHELYEMTAKS